VSSYYEGLIVFVCINVIAVAGLYVLLGATGLVSFGQGGFLATGAYISGLVTTKLNLPFYVGIILGVLGSMVLGIIIGYPTLKLRREYFALATMGWGEAIRALIIAFPKITGGSVGLSGIPQKSTLGLTFFLTLASLFIVRNFLISKYGRNANAIMTDELAAEAIGIHTFLLKQEVFALTCGLSGLAGALLAHYITYIDPSIFSWTRSAELVTIVFLGGLGSFTGSIVAAIVVTILPEVLRFAAEARFLFYAVVILLVIIYRPGGIFGQWELSWAWFKKMWNKRVRHTAREGAQ